MFFCPCTKNGTVKFKIYTRSHRPEVLAGLNLERPFTSEERTAATMMEYSGTSPTQESIIRDFLSRDSIKLGALSFLIQYIYKKDYKKILSLGAGTCVIEYLLKASLPEDSVVVAADFDRFSIDLAKKYFPSLVPVAFDFFRDDIAAVARFAGIDFDMAYFLNSSYVMDDQEYVRILKQLKDNRIRTVIDLTSACIPIWSLPRTIAGEYKSRILHEYRGKCHGFTRTRGEFRHMYRRSGWRVVRETAIAPYNYVAILENAM
jgi:hypothetical protein